MDPRADHASALAHRAQRQRNESADGCVDDGAVEILGRLFFGAACPARAKPPGRRAACWPPSPSLFSGIVVRGFRFGATMELGRSGRSMVRPMLTSASPGRRRRWCRRRSSAASYGVIGNRSENLQHQRSTALTLMARHSRARGGPPLPARSVSRPTRAIWSSRLGGAPPAGRCRHLFLAELLFADSGSERRWSSGGRGDRW